MPHVNDLHEQHDPMLVVSLASGDLATADRDRATAQSLVATCADCALLHDDVLALATATKALPPAVRTRDFRISPEQAAKLQPGGWRRFFTAPGALFSRQLGVGLTTLGIAGILISSIGALPIGGFASSAGGAAPASVPSEAPAAAEALRSEDTQQAPAPAASVELDTSNTGGGLTVPFAGSPGASPYGVTAAGASPPAASNGDQSGRNAASQSPVTPVAENIEDGSNIEATTDGSTSGPPILLVVSSLLLVGGLIVLVARRLASGARSA
jgi:hypothetical protein